MSFISPRHRVNLGSRRACGWHQPHGVGSCVPFRGVSSASSRAREQSNAATADCARQATVYFDPRLSLTASVSCVSCKRVTSSGTVGLLFFSFGVLGRVDVPRHVLTVFNAVFNTVQFWDGRAKSLDRPRDGTPPRASSGSRKLGDGPTFP